ncbi:ArsR family transcriptional regulator [Carbonactinospora thermoautotrophica]|uniref:Transcriptional regulator n=1 Tax=Carbonactinospora thermoautotrophica TaxID=1469144 RepID=A0A132MZ91_9ACTN|nr:metalloregulator ArsR/SmtB family transcription factor [Carbonactinospora thermoautotrophica]KWX03046.1 Transcriptional regulator [Carbonactinospora thermoautotrophica]MCX9193239.1 ArsR family transcriptional regulator [Carbonactinospora thermoautotrophica]
MRARELRTADLTEACTPLRGEKLSPQRAAVLADAFKALGDPVRLRILNLLLTAPEGKVCACDLVDPVGRSQPTVSHHLKVLREAGLVTADRRGTWIFYSAVPERLEALTRVLNPGHQPAAVVGGAA